MICIMKLEWIFLEILYFWVFDFGFREWVCLIIMIWLGKNEKFLFMFECNENWCCFYIILYIFIVCWSIVECFILNEIKLSYFWRNYFNFMIVIIFLFVVDISCGVSICVKKEMKFILINCVLWWVKGYLLLWVFNFYII